VLLLVARPPAIAQTAATPIQVPFEAWMQEGARTDIEWVLKVSKPKLGISQRQHIEVLAEIRGTKLNQPGAQPELLIVSALRPVGGEWSASRGVAKVIVDRPLEKREWLQIRHRAFLRPGNYELGVILADRTSGRRNVALRRIEVLPLKKDPLPEADRDLPAVEFIQGQKDLDTVLLPGVESRLHLPVASKSRLRVDVLLNLTPSMFMKGSKLAVEATTLFMVGVSRLLSQLEFRNGSLRISALDLERQRILYELNGGEAQDWEAVRTSVAGINPASIDVRSLSQRKQSAAYLRRVVEEKLTARLGRDERRVVIVVTTPVLFEWGSDLKSIPALPECDCRVYYLQYRIFFRSAFDDLSRVLKNLKPRKFTLDSPLELREALAEILAELRTM
jgi:hypothetical protein